MRLRTSTNLTVQLNISHLHGPILHGLSLKQVIEKGSKLQCSVLSLLSKAGVMQTGHRTGHSGATRNLLSWNSLVLRHRELHSTEECSQRLRHN